MKLLDLFCGAGGAAMGYRQAGFDEIVGVDNQPQKRYPFEFVQADALEYLAQHGREFDVIHASPPCQGYSKLRRVPYNKGKKYALLIEPTRRLLRSSGKPYSIENVAGACKKTSDCALRCHQHAKKRGCELCSYFGVEHV